MYTYNPVKAIQKTMIRQTRKGFYLSQIQHLTKNPSQPVPNRVTAMQHSIKQSGK